MKTLQELIKETNNIEEAEKLYHEQQVKDWQKRWQEWVKKKKVPNGTLVGSYKCGEREVYNNPARLIIKIKK